MGLHASFELRVRDGIPKSGDIDPELSRSLNHAYLACVSYVDAQVGLVLDALDESGQRDNTIIIIWGDHGWHLGDMGMWGKATNYEIATRVPLLLEAPGMGKSAGKKTEAIVELVDHKTDPHETKNVAKDHPEIVANLNRDLAITRADD